MNAKFMDRAILQAKRAYDEGEIPVGAVIVKDGEIIAEGRNAREKKHSVFSHAECEAIAVATEKTGDWRLDGCSMYVTLEPCMMCMGAILNSRISELCFGAFDPQTGVAESTPPEVFKNIKIYSGIREDECKKLLEDFFADARKTE